MLARGSGSVAQAAAAGSNARVAARAGLVGEVSASSSSVAAAAQPSRSQSSWTHNGSYLGASNQFPQSFFDEKTANVDRRGLGKNALPKSWKPKWQPAGQNPLEAVIRVEQYGGARVIELNGGRKGSQQALNRLDVILVKALTETLTQLETNPAINMIIIRGATDDIFSAGSDTEGLKQRLRDPATRDLALSFLQQQYQLQHLVANYTKPLVVGMHGLTLGSGFALASNARFPYVVSNAQLATPEVTQGLLPHGGSAYHLARMSNGLGAYMATTGAVLSAEEAFWGGVAPFYGLVSSGASGDVAKGGWSGAILQQAGDLSHSPATVWDLTRDPVYQRALRTLRDFRDDGKGFFVLSNMNEDVSQDQFESYVRLKRWYSYLAVGDKASAREALAESSNDGDGQVMETLFDFGYSQELEGRDVLPEPAFAAEERRARLAATTGYAAAIGRGALDNGPSLQTIAKLRVVQQAFAGRVELGDPQLRVQHDAPMPERTRDAVRAEVEAMQREDNELKLSLQQIKKSLGSGGAGDSAASSAGSSSSGSTATVTDEGKELLRLAEEQPQLLFKTPSLPEDWEGKLHVPTGAEADSFVRSSKNKASILRFAQKGAGVAGFDPAMSTIQLAGASHGVDISAEGPALQRVVLLAYERAEAVPPIAGNEASFIPKLAEAVRMAVPKAWPTATVDDKQIDGLLALNQLPVRQDLRHVVSRGVAWVTAKLLGKGITKTSNPWVLEDPRLILIERAQVLKAKETKRAPFAFLVDEREDIIVRTVDPRTGAIRTEKKTLLLRVPTPKRIYQDPHDHEYRFDDEEVPKALKESTMGSSFSDIADTAPLEPHMTASGGSGSQHMQAYLQDKAEDLSDPLARRMSEARSTMKRSITRPADASPPLTLGDNESARRAVVDAAKNVTPGPNALLSSAGSSSSGLTYQQACALASSISSVGSNSASTASTYSEAQEGAGAAAAESVAVDAAWPEGQDIRFRVMRLLQKLSSHRVPKSVAEAAASIAGVQLPAASASADASATTDESFVDGRDVYARALKASADGRTAFDADKTRAWLEKKGLESIALEGNTSNSATSLPLQEVATEAGEALIRSLRRHYLQYLLSLQPSKDASNPHQKSLEKDVKLLEELATSNNSSASNAGKDKYRAVNWAHAFSSGMDSLPLENDVALMHIYTVARNNNDQHTMWLLGCYDALLRGAPPVLPTSFSVPVEHTPAEFIRKARGIDALSSSSASSSASSAGPRGRSAMSASSPQAAEDSFVSPAPFDVDDEEEEAAWDESADEDSGSGRSSSSAAKKRAAASSASSSSRQQQYEDDDVDEDVEVEEKQYRSKRARAVVEKWVEAVSSSTPSSTAASSSASSSQGGKGGQGGAGAQQQQQGQGGAGGKDGSSSAKGGSSSSSSSSSSSPTLTFRRTVVANPVWGGMPSWLASRVSEDLEVFAGVELAAVSSKQGEGEQEAQAQRKALNALLRAVRNPSSAGVTNSADGSVSSVANDGFVITSDSTFLQTDYAGFPDARARALGASAMAARGRGTAISKPVVTLMLSKDYYSEVVASEGLKAALARRKEVMDTARSSLVPKAIDSLRQAQSVLEEARGKLKASGNSGNEASRSAAEKAYTSAKAEVARCRLALSEAQAKAAPTPLDTAVKAMGGKELSDGSKPAPPFDGDHIVVLGAEELSDEDWEQQQGARVGGVSSSSSSSSSSSGGHHHHDAEEAGFAPVALRSLSGGVGGGLAGPSGGAFSFPGSLSEPHETGGFAGGSLAAIEAALGLQLAVEDWREVEASINAREQGTLIDYSRDGPNKDNGYEPDHVRRMLTEPDYLRQAFELPEGNKDALASAARVVDFYKSRAEGENATVQVRSVEEILSRLRGIVKSGGTAKAEAKGIAGAERGTSVIDEREVRIAEETLKQIESLPMPLIKSVHALLVRASTRSLRETMQDEYSALARVACYSPSELQAFVDRHGSKSAVELGRALAQPFEHDDAAGVAAAGNSALFSPEEMKVVLGKGKLSLARRSLYEAQIAARAKEVDEWTVKLVKEYESGLHTGAMGDLMRRRYAWLKRSLAPSESYDPVLWEEDEHAAEASMTRFERMVGAAARFAPKATQGIPEPFSAAAAPAREGGKEARSLPANSVFSRLASASSSDVERMVSDLIHSAEERTAGRSNKALR